MRNQKNLIEELVKQVPLSVLEQVTIIEIRKNDKVLVKDIYGKCLTTKSSLRRGCAPSIKTAIDKTEYFKNKLRDLNPHYKNNKFEVLGGYRGVYNKILCKDKYGEVLMSPPELLNGRDTNVKSAVSRRKYQINQFKEVHGDTYEYLDSFYKEDNRKEYYNVKCKCGNISAISFDNILLGRGCNKCWVKRNSTRFKKYKTEEDFIKTCENILDIDLENCGFKTLGEKIKVRCTKHDVEFYQQASSTLGGMVGCPYCKKGVNTLFDKDFIGRSRGRDAFLYLVVFSGNGETFCKVGRTYQKIERRFGLGNNFKVPYKLTEIVCVKKDRPEKIVQIENLLLETYRKSKYNPQLQFNGHTECFKINAVEDIKKYFQTQSEGKH